MPLIKSKSKKAFNENVSTEVHAGKPVKQAVAIAYSEKRHAKKSHGGSISLKDCEIRTAEGKNSKHKNCW